MVRPMDRIIAVGDIHGCLNTLKELLKNVAYNSQTDTLVFIGDYIDRGAKSCETVAFLRKLQQQVGRDKCICLRGNHEQMAIDAYEDGDNSLWYYNGGGATTWSYDRNGADIASDIGWFKSLPFVYDTPEIIFCHAGLSKPLLKDNTVKDLIWGRDWIRKNDKRPREKQVVFGHTPNPAGIGYTVATGDICIDAACVYGGKLCALVIEEDGNGKLVYADQSEEDCIDYYENSEEVS